MITFCHMKQLTPYQKSLNFKCVKLVLIGHIFICYLHMYNQMIVSPSFLRHKLKLLSMCCVFKVRQYIPNLCHDHLHWKCSANVWLIQVIMTVALYEYMQNNSY